MEGFLGGLKVTEEPNERGPHPPRLRAVGGIHDVERDGGHGVLPSIRNRGKRDSPTRGARRAAIGGEGGGDQLSGGGFFSRRDLLREVASA